MKKIILKGNIRTKYIEYKQKIMEVVVIIPFTYPNYSVLIHPQNVGKPYH